MDARVGVVMVNWNTCDLTLKALRALFASSFLPSEVVLVDNASTDGSVEVFRKEFPQLQIIENSENVGFARANNQGVEAFRTNVDYVWLLNSDTETGKESLGQLVSFLDKNLKVAAVGPILVYPNGDWQSVGGFFPGFWNIFYYSLPFPFFLPKFLHKKLQAIAIFPQPVPESGLVVDYVTGAALLVRKTVWDAVGGLPTAYFMYFEETDMCFAIRKMGYTVVAVHTEPVVHVYGGSYKTKYDSRRVNQFFTSLRFFVERNYIGWYKHMLIWEIALLSPVAKLLKSFKSFV